jgi:hypothetical protein
VRGGSSCLQKGQGEEGGRERCRRRSDGRFVAFIV